MKHICCYSGGNSSALAAIEVARKYGKDDVIILNHDINPNVEDKDIKRFKKEVADYLGIGITYANMDGWDTKDQFDVTVEIGAFKVGNGTELCTNRLKTAPFYKWLKDNVPNKNCVIYYGFDPNEITRIQRRSSILGQQGYKTDYPLALWKERTIKSTNEITITPPLTYGMFKHANCIGCLKAGKQHWYCVYMTRQDIWEKAKTAEEKIGYSIIKNMYIEDLEEEFETMKQLGIKPTEHIKSATFWKMVKKELISNNILKNGQLSIFDFKDSKPCECIF